MCGYVWPWRSNHEANWWNLIIFKMLIGLSIYSKVAFTIWNWVSGSKFRNFEFKTWVPDITKAVRFKMKMNSCGHCFSVDYLHFKPLHLLLEGSSVSKLLWVCLWQWITLFCELCFGRCPVEREGCPDDPLSSLYHYIIFDYSGAATTT